MSSAIAWLALERARREIGERYSGRCHAEIEISAPHDDTAYRALRPPCVGQGHAAVIEGQKASSVKDVTRDAWAFIFCAKSLAATVQFRVACPSCRSPASPSRASRGATWR